MCVVVCWWDLVPSCSSSPVVLCENWWPRKHWFCTARTHEGGNSFKQRVDASPDMAIVLYTINIARIFGWDTFSSCFDVILALSFIFFFIVASQPCGCATNKHTCMFMCAQRTHGWLVAFARASCIMFCDVV